MKNRWLKNVIKYAKIIKKQRDKNSKNMKSCPFAVFAMVWVWLESIFIEKSKGTKISEN